MCAIPLQGSRKIKMNILRNNWQIITKDRLNEWHIQQKTVKFKEHDCTLTVNKTSVILKLPRKGYLANFTFDSTTPDLLHAALLQAEANERDDIRTMMRFREYLELTLPVLNIRIRAVSSLKGVGWLVGNRLLSVDECPNVWDVTKHLYVGTEDISPGESFINYPKPVWEKLNDMGCTEPVVQKEFHDGQSYEWSLYFDSLELRMESTSSSGNDEPPMKFFNFSITSYEHAVAIRQQILTKQWDMLLEHCYEYSGDAISRFTAYGRMTEAIDIDLDLSADSKLRGFWAVPSSHSLHFSGPRIQTTIPEKKLDTVTLAEAKLLVEEYRQEKTPNFKLLTWPILKSLMEHSSTWSLEENNVRLEHAHGRLTARFYGLNDYPKVVLLPSDNSFDQALINAWHKNDGYLRHR